MNMFVPQSEEEVLEIVVAALANGTAIDVIGTGSREGLGHPTGVQKRLSTSKLSGVVYYEPSELILTAQAGTSLSFIKELLDQHNQELAFEPIDHGPLYGNPRGSGTIGGLVAVNASGPRRIKVGAARDHFLGFRAISGRGEIFQSGGRVMKNVTGYDMSKLMAGSFGTFGIFSEITVKVMPRAETELTLLIVGLDDDRAVEAMTSVSGLSYETSGFAHLPVLKSNSSSSISEALAEKPLTAFRLEGSENSVNTRRKGLTSHLSEKGRRIEVLDAGSSREFWADLRDGVPVTGSQDQIWRISTAPASGAQLVKELLARNVPVNEYYYDWAGGLIWFAVTPASHAHGDVIRKVVNLHGGHATLIRASEEVRATVPVFHPQAPALVALTDRIRNSFDPQVILNRGRVRGHM